MVGWHTDSRDMSLNKLQDKEGQGQEGQGSLARCSPQGHKELNRT